MSCSLAKQASTEDHQQHSRGPALSAHDACWFQMDSAYCKLIPSAWQRGDRSEAEFW